MTMLEIPTAIHRGDDELPWVDIGDGSLLKVLQIKEREGLWVIRNRFMPGYDVQTHKHTGPVYAFTMSGAWCYKESDFVNRAGSFLYEPAGSVHTLTRARRQHRADRRVLRDLGRQPQSRRRRQRREHHRRRRHPPGATT